MDTPNARSAPHLFPTSSPSSSASPSPTAPEAHTHIWRLSVESALVKLTTEVSALREQASHSRRRTPWGSPSTLAKSLSLILLLALFYLLNNRRTRARFLACLAWLTRMRLRLRFREAFILWLKRAAGKLGDVLSRLSGRLEAAVARKWDGRALVLDLVLLLPVLGLVGGRWGQLGGWLGLLGRAAERLVWRLVLRP
ncbi:MAG: hypothetical protein M1824_002781 [Vezdaea acicularis]|nr:MAG: hypothetical protein M1824_002781 [Vezdaea acicularis]